MQGRRLRTARNREQSPNLTGSRALLGCVLIKQLAALCPHFRQSNLSVLAWGLLTDNARMSVEGKSVALAGRQTSGFTPINRRIIAPCQRKRRAKRRARPTPPKTSARKPRASAAGTITG